MSTENADESARESAVPSSAANSTSLPAEVLELEYVYSALAHPRRRYLCYTLLEDTEWSLTDLATKVAAWERDVSTSAVTDAQRDDVSVSLYHAHVPKLVDEDIVAFDPVSGTNAWTLWRLRRRSSGRTWPANPGRGPGRSNSNTRDIW